MVTTYGLKVCLVIATIWGCPVMVVDQGQHLYSSSIVLLLPAPLRHLSVHPSLGARGREAFRGSVQKVTETPEQTVTLSCNRVCGRDAAGVRPELF